MSEASHIAKGTGRTTRNVGCNLRKNSSRNSEGLSLSSLLPQTQETLRILPFLRYSSQYWHAHFKVINGLHGHFTINMILLLYDEAHEIELRNSIMVWSPDQPWEEPFSSHNFASR